MKTIKFGNKNINANQVLLGVKPIENPKDQDETLKNKDRMMVGVVHVSPAATLGGWYNNTEVVREYGN